ncbi:MAG TPA: glycine--tRNA ligase subunit beta [Burkholderiales bacterium]|nr:glycine--tRNA ligase subunit beta [Burkholderiales bacterium]
MPDTLLVELLTEELPPKALQQLGTAFADQIASGLSRHQLTPFDPTKIERFATPRRLSVAISGVLDQAPDRVSTEKIMPVAVALDAAGRPTPALTKKLESKSIPLTEISTFERRLDGKSEALFYTFTVKGARLDAVLADIVADAVRKLPTPKRMRWGSGDAEFVRPVHGLVLMHGDRVVHGSVLGLDSGNTTLGHRFLSRGVVTIAHAGRYAETLEREGRVLASFAERRRRIEQGLTAAAGTDSLVATDALLDEVTALVEWPVVYSAAFDPAFLGVPPECLVLSMQQHQKYLPLRDGDGKLLPRFLLVSNVEPGDPHNVVAGNERVLRARLSDAKFFYEQDRKTRLEQRVPRLAAVVYHGKLGSQLERTERIQLLAGAIARRLGTDPAPAERAAWLAKADLLTDMVGEFPELQGVMGRYYALGDGEPAEVADAIEAHYRPRFAGDAPPAAATSAVVALADKLDTLAGLFGIGQIPTGDKDPFGLRRAALGVVRILIERDLALSLADLIDAAFAGFGPRVGAAQSDLQEFVFDRLAGYLKDRGYSTLEVESVVSQRPVQINAVPRQVEAVRAFNALPEAQSLAAANKRVVNILKQAAARGESFANAESGGLKEPAEMALFDALRITSQQATSLFRQGDFTGYLKSFAVLKSPVDAFFDAVMVMVDDAELRRNRLALLADLRREMNRVADISKLAA